VFVIHPNTPLLQHGFKNCRSAQEIAGQSHATLLQ
jgi:hypothetical protein